MSCAWTVTAKNWCFCVVQLRNLIGDLGLCLKEANLKRPFHGVINQVAFSTGISLGGCSMTFEFSMFLLFCGREGVFISGKAHFVGQEVA